MGAFRERITAQPGETLRIRPQPGAVHLFDTQSGQRIAA
jgi:multiple sugar transport system ATP-binding protein